jgi:hypothetical protein
MLVKVSPSQIKTWRSCEAQWAFAHVERIFAPSTPKQAFGDKVHAQLARWSKNGTPPDARLPEGRVADQAIKPGWIPTPGPHLLVDKDYKIELPIGDDIMLVGYPDLTVPPDLTDPIPTVIDYKSTTDLQYAMTEEEMGTDPQVIVYSAAVMHAFRVRQARARWLYLVATNPKDPNKPREPAGSAKRERVMSADDPEFQREWKRLIEDARAIAKAKRAWTTAELAKKEPTACEAYGGCFYAKSGKCKVSADDALVAHVAQFDREHGNEAVSEGGNVNLLEKLQGMKPGAAAPAATTPAPASTPAPATAAPAPAPAPQASAPAAAPAGTGLFAALTGATTVNPPEGAGKTEPPIAGLVTQQHGPAEKVAETAPVAAPVETKLPPAPPKAEPAPAATAAPSTEATTITGEVLGKSNGVEGLVVIFDALFTKRNEEWEGGVITLGEWIKPLADAVAKEYQAERWNLVDYKGPAALALKVERAIEKLQPKGVILVDSETAEGKALKEVLIRKARIVIQGVRS